jgi:hypothetical protein
MEKNSIYPVITLHNPWATWVMLGWKTIETRLHPRFKSLKGKTILIHAGQHIDTSYHVTDNPFLTAEQKSSSSDNMVSGAILCSAYVYEFDRLEKHNSEEALIDCDVTQRFGLFLSKIVRLENPIPIKGGQGIWYYDLEKREKVTVTPKKVKAPELFTNQTVAP